jgi:hypothetical protein
MPLSGCSDIYSLFMNRCAYVIENTVFSGPYG